MFRQECDELHRFDHAQRIVRRCAIGSKTYANARASSSGVRKDSTGRELEIRGRIRHERCACFADEGELVIVEEVSVRSYQVRSDQADSLEQRRGSASVLLKAIVDFALSL